MTQNMGLFAFSLPHAIRTVPTNEINKPSKMHMSTFIILLLLRDYHGQISELEFNLSTTPEADIPKLSKNLRNLS